MKVRRTAQAWRKANGKVLLRVAVFLSRIYGTASMYPALIGGTYVSLRLAVPGACLNQMTPHGWLTEFGVAGVYSR